MTKLYCFLTLVVIEWLLSTVLLLQKHPEVHKLVRNEGLQKRRAIVDVQHQAVEDKEPIYRQTREEFDAGKYVLSTKKKF